MRRTSKSKPSFFKAMINDFSRDMQLPPAFVQKHGERLAKNTKLKTNSGEIWNVELEKFDKEIFYFTRGWKEFTQGVGVKFGEFLVFCLNIGSSTFDVSVFGASLCERRITASNPRSSGPEPVKCEDGKSDETGEEDDDHTSEDEHLRFKLILKENHRSRVSLRKKFIEAASLFGKKAVVLKYKHGTRFGAALLRQSQLSHELGCGWGEFVRENLLVIGESYLFEYDPATNVIEVGECFME